MAKIRLKKKKVRYATVSRKLLSNPKISLRAKGLGAWLEYIKMDLNLTLNLSYKI